MKALKSTMYLAGILLMLVLSMNISNAQTPPAPPGHDKGGNQGKGTSGPIEGGLGISLILVAGYGAWKALKNRKKG